MSNDNYPRESSATGWFVAIIAGLAIVAIGYLVFAANSPVLTAAALN